MSSDNPEPPIPHPPADTDSNPAPRPIPPANVILLGRVEAPSWQFVPVPPQRRMTKPRKALVLFLLTCLSTFLVGFYDQPVFPHWAFVQLLYDPDSVDPKFGSLWAHFQNGLAYSTCVIAILGAHEMGHYLQSRRYGVPASLPYFIPLPISPFGTMGAVIVQQGGVANRKSLFDIAISGPLAGLVFALPIAYWGIVKSHISDVPLAPDFPDYGSPLLMKWMSTLVHGTIPKGAYLPMNPQLFAGWVGIFITGLNLIPIGQLDGGHILYCLIGRPAHFVARGLFFLAAGVVAYSYFFGDNSFMSWWLMLVLIWMFGTKHPPTANDRVPLGTPRIVLGWLTLMFVFIGLTPRPIAEFKSKQQAQVERNTDQEIHN
jgi:Zn-dependent protease